MDKEKLLWIRDYLKEMYQTPILENFLQLEVDEIEEGKVKYSMKVIDRHCNIYGFVHGGTLASISDVVMGVSCLTLGKRIVTTDMGISYIKNVSAGSTITAVGEVISDGKTIMRAVGMIFDENQQLLVSSHASYYVIGEFSQNDYNHDKKYKASENK